MALSTRSDNLYTPTGIIRTGRLNHLNDPKRPSVQPLSHMHAVFPAFCTISFTQNAQSQRYFLRHIFLTKYQIRSPISEASLNHFNLPQESDHQLSSLPPVCNLPNLSKRERSTRKRVMARERMEAATQPTVMWSIRTKALMGLIPPRRIPPNNNGIEVRQSTERLAMVGEMTANKLRRRKGCRALKWGCPLPRRNSYCCSSVFSAVT